MHFKKKKIFPRLLFYMFWRIYSLILVVILLPTYSRIMKCSPTIFDYLDMVICVGALLGLIGFSFGFRIISAKLWRVYFFLVISWDLFYNILITMILDLAVHLPNEVKLGWTGVIVSFAIIIPEYIGLFRYGYKSDDLWNK
jgi:hypothetical protein